MENDAAHGDAFHLQLVNRKKKIRQLVIGQLVGQVLHLCCSIAGLWGCRVGPTVKSQFSI